MSAATADPAPPLLSARGVGVSFPGADGDVPAVRGVDLDIASSETVALVGETGCGKSALSRALVRLHDAPFGRSRTRVSGRILWRGARGCEIDLAQADAATLRRVRATEIAIVFQEAMSGLNPVMTVRRQVIEALRVRDPALPLEAARREAVALLEEIGIRRAARVARSYPHVLSGGMRQRVMIAMAAIRSPELLIADEPTTALDVTVQAQIVALLKRLQRTSGMAVLFITHDLGLVAQVADRVAVMYAGRLVEVAPTAEFFAGPQHPYARGLLGTLPLRRVDVAAPPLIGNAPEPGAVPSGCAFRPRCRFDGPICREEPALVTRRGGYVRCWHPIGEGGYGGE